VSDVQDRTVASPTDEQLAEDVRRVLDGIIDPCSAGHGVPMGLDEMGLIREVKVRDGSVHVSMRLTSPCCFNVGFFAEETKTRVGALPSVVSVEFSSDTGFDWDASMIKPEADARRRQALGPRPALLTVLPRRP